jgi:hypothetical protein
MAPRSQGAERYRPAPVRLPDDIFRHKNYRDERITEHRTLLNDDGSSWDFPARGGLCPTPSGITFVTRSPSMANKLSGLGGAPPGADLSAVCAFDPACLPEDSYDLFDRFFWSAEGEVVSSGSANKIAFGIQLSRSHAPEDRAYASAIALMAFLLCRPDGSSYRGALLGTASGYFDRVRRPKRSALDLALLGEHYALGYPAESLEALGRTCANHPADYPAFLLPNLARSFDLIEIVEGVPPSHVEMLVDEGRPNKLLIYARPGHLEAWIDAVESSGEWPSFGTHYYIRDDSVLFLKPLDLVRPDTPATRRAEAARQAAENLSIRQLKGEIRRDAARAELIRRYGKGADDV